MKYDHGCRVGPRLVPNLGVSPLAQSNETNWGKLKVLKIVTSVR